MPYEHLTNEETIRIDLAGVVAAAQALGDCPTNKAKGEFLIEFFKLNPHIIKYFRFAYNPERWVADRVRSFAVEMGFGKTYATSIGPCGKSVLDVFRKLSTLPYPDNAHLWVSFLWWLEDRHEASRAACMLLNRDFECGLTLNVLQKVFDRLEIPRLVMPFKFEVGHFPDPKIGRYASAKISWCHVDVPYRERNVPLETRAAADTIAWLAGLGVPLFNIPLPVLGQAKLIEYSGDDYVRRGDYPDNIPF